MKNLYTIFLVALLSLSAQASLKSPFASTVDGITINNTHTVGSDGKIFRGQAPLGKIEQLRDAGFTDILIFKNQTRSEIDEEYAELISKDAGHIQTKQIDFLWHAYPSYKIACEQMIAGLKYLKEVKESKNRKIFFHCTVGEDRTGALAGLWRMLSSKYTMKKAFYSEMCENGYGRGNANKPYYVYNEIRSDLTPLFIYMAQKIEKQELTYDNINSDICIDSIDKKKIKKLKCKISSKFPRRD